ncbi:glycosyltransferase family 2 protein [Candidatus Roizmanbacteria bacterium]|nr:glycosyltransferase family 2 protein [Candidatus Roizmanbacteria bacterium]
MKNNLAILTVVYNNYEVLDDFVASLERQTNKNFHLFIADASTNQKPIEISNIPFILTLIENRGYAYGINTLLKKAIDEKFQYFCVINNDTYVKENFVENTLNAIKGHPSSIIGGKIYYAPGYEYHKDRYSAKEKGMVLWYTGGFHDWNHVYTHHRGVDEVDAGQYDAFEETEFVTGCCMIFDKNVVKKVGYWDESFFLYFEDADYCERALRSNIKLYYDPSIVLWHKNAQSTEGSGSSLHQEYQNKNRIKFGLKYAPFRTKLHLLKNYLLRR